MASTSSDKRIVPAVLMKERRMLVSVLNTGDGEIAVRVRLPEGMHVSGGMERRLWEASKDDISPRISHLECGVQDWTSIVPARSLVHFALTVEKQSSPSSPAPN